MSPPEPLTEKKYFTVAEANAMLPLVRSIVRDITELARSLRDRQETKSHGGTLLCRANDGPEAHDPFSQSYREEREVAQQEMEQDQERLQEYVAELRKLGVELKDFFMGLVDFPTLREGREVFLCWKQGEATIAHWHEIDDGFAGRQPLDVESN